MHTLLTSALQWCCILACTELRLVKYSLSGPDGTHELFVGLTDRVVGVFRWNGDTLELHHKWILSGQVINYVHLHVLQYRFQSLSLYWHD